MKLIFEKRRNGRFQCRQERRRYKAYQTSGRYFGRSGESEDIGVAYTRFGKREEELDCREGG
jgi:hypothetical protein